ncbi:MAG TPA: response regulator, partial [Candidatus Tectomicrobia bacterium]
MSHNILLIQDDPADAKTVREALMHTSDGPFYVIWVRRCSEGLARLARDGKQDPQRTHGIAVVVVDLCLPDSHGIETFDRLFRAAPQIPILILSATHEEAIAKLAVQHGAQDYLPKARLDG